MEKTEVAGVIAIRFVHHHEFEIGEQPTNASYVVITLWDSTIISSLSMVPEDLHKALLAHIQPSDLVLEGNRLSWKIDDNRWVVVYLDFFSLRVLTDREHQKYLYHRGVTPNGN